MTLSGGPTRPLSAVLFACLAIATAAASAGCGLLPDLRSDDRKVRATIERYDEMLAKGYESQDMTPMREVATELQANDEYIHMSAIGEGGVWLVPKLQSIEFDSVSVEGTKATAVTREVWDYEQRSTVTRKAVVVQEDFMYLSAWDLERQADGSWLVSDMRVIEATSAVSPSILGTLTPTPRGR